MATPTKPRRLGIIGLSAAGSWASRAHLPYLNRTDQYKIVALQNSSKGSAEKAASQYNLDDVATYGDTASFVADPNVDIVAVSVKVPDHKAAIEPVLEAKKDVFVEWPLARNLEEAEYLTSLAKQNKVTTLVGLQARHNPSIRKAKELVESGKLGDILGTTLNAHGGVFGPSITPDYKYMTPVEAGANLLTIPFGHGIDALCYVLGEFQDLQATLANHRPRLPVFVDGKAVETVDKTAHDHIAVIGRLVRGGGVASVVYQGGMSKTDKNFYWEITGTKGSLVFEGPIGHVQMYQPTLKFVAAEDGGKLEEVDVKKIGNDFSHNVGSA